MHSTWFFSLSSVVIVSLASFIGIVAISSNAKRVQNTVFILVSLAVGAMFGDAFIHLLPEAFKLPNSELSTPIFILMGIIIFFLLEKFLLWRHEHVPHYEECIQPVGYVNLVAEGMHNLIDGLLIGSSYLVSFHVGLATTLAVLLHEIPQEIGNFGVLLHAGFTINRALWLNFLSASFSIVGAIIALIAGEYIKGLPAAILPLTAGGFIYIAGSDLVPEMHKEREPMKSLFQLLAMGAGIGLMLLLTLFE